MRKKLVAFTGAGISAESGLKTFRDSNGLWEEYNIEDVATPQAWSRNPALVLEFYNKRREQAYLAKPNKAHELLAKAEKLFDVHVITQNVDSLHERAGSTHVHHLHGELDKVRSTIDEDYILPLNGKPIAIGDNCPKGGQLRPHVVWFGEQVPAMDYAIQLVSSADYMLVIGTSLQVYPAAGLIQFFARHKKGFYIDPEARPISESPNFEPIRASASLGVETALKLLSD